MGKQTSITYPENRLIEDFIENLVYRIDDHNGHMWRNIEHAYHLLQLLPRIEESPEEGIFMYGESVYANKEALGKYIRQNYELGGTRIGAPRIAEVYKKVPVTYFFISGNSVPVLPLVALHEVLAELGIDYQASVSRV